MEFNSKIKKHGLANVPLYPPSKFHSNIFSRFWETGRNTNSATNARTHARTRVKIISCQVLLDNLTKRLFQQTCSQINRIRRYRKDKVVTARYHGVCEVSWTGTAQYITEDGKRAGAFEWVPRIDTRSNSSNHNPNIFPSKYIVELERKRMR
jgi:hypothetical protein